MNETQLIARSLRLPDEVQAVALRGLGREYVTGQDANLLRSIRA